MNNEITVEVQTLIKIYSWYGFRGCFNMLLVSISWCSRHRSFVNVWPLWYEVTPSDMCAFSEPYSPLPPTQQFEGNTNKPNLGRLHP